MEEISNDVLLVALVGLEGLSKQGRKPLIVGDSLDFSDQDLLGPGKYNI